MKFISGLATVPGAAILFTACDRSDSFIQGATLTSSHGPQLEQVCPTTQLDPAFGQNGLASSTVSPGGGIGRAIGVEPDGSVVVAGSAIASSTKTNFSLLKLTSIGLLDRSFGPNGDGTAQTAIGSLNDDIYALAIQPNGKIVTVGRSLVVASPATSVFAIARYELDGSLDSSFGSNGIVKTTISNGGDNQAIGVAFDISGNILVAGMTTHSTSEHYRFVVARYLPQGTLDNTFGSAGVVITSLNPGGGDSIPGGIALQPDGKIVVSGISYSNAAGAPVQVGAIVRYNSDGSLDRSFAGVGYELVPALNLMGKVRVDHRGKIVVAGGATPSSNGYIPTLARLNGDGSLDSSFGQNGVVQTGLGSSGMNLFTDIVLQPNGQILGVAFMQNGSAQLIRYNESGDLDNCFGGWKNTQTGSNLDWNQGVALQPNGGILVGGHGFAGGLSTFSASRFH